MSVFGDTEPADALDVTGRADPEQVARRLHELRRDRDRNLAPWEVLGAGERAAAVAIMLALLEWLRREGTSP